MKLFSIILIYIGAVLILFTLAMSFFCVENSEYAKKAIKFYRWMLLFGIIIASIGTLILKFAV